MFVLGMPDEWQMRVENEREISGHGLQNDGHPERSEGPRK